MKPQIATAPSLMIDSAIKRVRSPDLPCFFHGINSNPKIARAKGENTKGSMRGVARIGEPYPPDGLVVAGIRIVPATSASDLKVDSAPLLRGQ